MYGNVGNTETVTPVVADKLDELRELCRKHHVLRLALFGSAVSDQFDTEKSDLDFLAEFEELPRKELVRAYFGMLNETEDLFGRPVDLVMEGANDNPYFLQRVEETKIPVYGL